jgi:hypothetical protein
MQIGHMQNAHSFFQRASQLNHALAPDQSIRFRRTINHPARAAYRSGPCQFHKMSSFYIHP